MKACPICGSQFERTLNRHMRRIHSMTPVAGWTPVTSTGNPNPLPGTPTYVQPGPPLSQAGVAQEASEHDIQEAVLATLVFGPYVSPHAVIPVLTGPPVNLSFSTARTVVLAARASARTIAQLCRPYMVPLGGNDPPSARLYQSSAFAWADVRPNSEMGGPLSVSISDTHSLSAGSVLLSPSGPTEGSTQSDNLTAEFQGLYSTPASQIASGHEPDPADLSVMVSGTAATSGWDGVAPTSASIPEPHSASANPAPSSSQGPAAAYVRSDSLTARFEALHSTPTLEVVREASGHGCGHPDLSALISSIVATPGTGERTRSGTPKSTQGELMDLPPLPFEDISPPVELELWVSENDENLLCSGKSSPSEKAPVTPALVMGTPPMHTGVTPPVTTAHVAQQGVPLAPAPPPKGDGAKDSRAVVRADAYGHVRQEVSYISAPSGWQSPPSVKRGVQQRSPARNDNSCAPSGGKRQKSQSSYAAPTTPYTTQTATGFSYDTPMPSQRAYPCDWLKKLDSVHVPDSLRRVKIYDSLRRGQPWSLALKMSTTTVIMADSVFREAKGAPEKWEIKVYPGARFEHVLAILNVVDRRFCPALRRVILYVGINHKTDNPIDASPVVQLMQRARELDLELLCCLIPAACNMSPLMKDRIMRVNEMIMSATEGMYIPPVPSCYVHSKGDVEDEIHYNAKSVLLILKSMVRYVQESSPSGSRF